MKASIPRIVLRTALGAAGCAYASLVLLPGSALASWLSRIPLVAQAIAFPSITAAGTVLAVAAALLGGLLARRGEGPRAGGGQRAAKAWKEVIPPWRPSRDPATEAAMALVCRSWTARVRIVKKMPAPTSSHMRTQEKSRSEVVDRTASIWSVHEACAIAVIAISPVLLRRRAPRRREQRLRAGGSYRDRRRSVR